MRYKKIKNNIGNALILGGLAASLVVPACMTLSKGPSGIASAGQLAEDIRAAPRKTHTVYPGETLADLYMKSFPLAEDEYAPIDEFSNGFRWEEEGRAPYTYKDALASNLWTRIVAEENGLEGSALRVLATGDPQAYYAIEPGTELRLPYRG